LFYYEYLISAIFLLMQTTLISFFIIVGGSINNLIKDPRITTNRHAYNDLGRLQKNNVIKDFNFKKQFSKINF